MLNIVKTVNPSEIQCEKTRKYYSHRKPTRFLSPFKAEGRTFILRRFVPLHEHARSRGLFATEETRHGRPSAPAAGAPRHPGAMFASVVRTMMGVNAEPRKFRCVRYASLAGRASRVGHIERFSDTSAEAHRIVPVRRRDRPPSAPHPPDPFRRPLAGSTSPSATSPGSPPAWTPPCSRWYAPADVSRDRRATAREKSVREDVREKHALRSPRFPTVGSRP